MKPSRPTRCSSRWIPSSERCGCRIGANCSCRTRSASSSGCRTSLVAAFRATLEEVAAADLLLHVIDASNPDRERQMDAVQSVLAEVGADRVPSIDVFNKCDQLDEGERVRLRNALSRRALRIGADAAKAATTSLPRWKAGSALDTARVTMEFDAGEASRERIAQLYRIGRILRHV